MADDTAADTQITATVTVALAAGLRIIADGASVESIADWTKEYEAAGSAVNDRVLATVRNPVRPIVTGTAQDGGA